VRLLAVLALAAVLAPAAAASPPPVTKIDAAGFGAVLARRDGQALYFWQREKAAKGKILCVGACAKLWPPLLVRPRTAVPARVPGISGRFGVVRRPDGRLQVTRNGLAVYTYVHEGPRQVLCDDVDGWFVVRL
jgi:predicted lipoprotein with Yx(FWY)xxD motif